jgi:ribose-phosphate pyrophosphokinase
VKRLLIPFPADLALAERLAPALRADVAPVRWHRFPDRESLVTLDPESVAGASVALVASLRDPDALALPLLFAAATARDLGATRVGLVAPYLAYMRQDQRFRPGEALSSRLFAGFLGDRVDWLVTVDPHLHRTASLAEIYAIPTRCAHAAGPVAAWIRETIERPMLIGPDAESEQWVSDIAGREGLPWQVLSKTRLDDEHVRIDVPDLEALRRGTPVIVDDIVSSGHTLLETIERLTRLGLPPPVVVAIHAVFAGESYERLRTARIDRIVSTDTICHPSNAISVAQAIAQASDELMG